MYSPFATPGNVAHQSSLSMGFPRQEYCSGFPFPSPGDLPHPGLLPCRQILYCLSHQGNPICPRCFCSLPTIWIYFCLCCELLVGGLVFNPGHFLASSFQMLFLCLSLSSIFPRSQCRWASPSPLNLDRALGASSC